MTDILLDHRVTYKFYGFINNLGACPRIYSGVRSRSRAPIAANVSPTRDRIFFPHDLQKVPHPQFQGQYYYIPEPFLKIGLS